MISRRKLLTATVAFAAIGMLAGPPWRAWAQDEGAAGFIDGMAREAIGVLQRGASAGDVRSEFRRLLNEGFDLPTIGRFVLGRYWNSATPEQQQEYLQLFEGMIVETYSRRFQNYNGETLKVLGTRAVGDQGDTLVETEVQQSDGPPVSVDWRVRGSGGRYRVIDVLVARVSMSVTQRDEFASVIAQNGGSVEGLLKALRARGGA